MLLVATAYQVLVSLCLLCTEYVVFAFELMSRMLSNYDSLGNKN
jgi:hypothetical protein